MKSFLALFLGLIICWNVFAQTPSAFKYQALVRNSSGEIVTNQSISFRISILTGSNDGAIVYQEEHSVTSNDNGLVYFSIGEGTDPSSDFESIDWGNSTHFVQVEMDIDGGVNYDLLGVSQLLSVPYALYAKSVENDAVDDADNDPTNEIQNISLNGTELSISNGSTIDLQPSFLWSANNNDITYTAGKVGIGTNDPKEATLRIDSDDVFALILERNADVYGNTQANLAISSEGGDNGFRIRVSNNDGFTWDEGLFINADATTPYTGYVGIGKTLPHYKLDVDGTVNASGYLINGTPLNSGIDDWTNSGNDISFSSGNVGIGTTTPVTKLDIRGNGEMEPYPAQISNEGTNEFRLYSASNISYANSSVIFNRSRGGIGSESDLISGDRVGGIYWSPYLSNDFQRTAAIHAYIGDGVTSSSYPTNIRFETTLVGSSIREEIMRISEEGNVGIGTDVPKSKLQIKSGDVYIEDIGSGVIMKSPNGSCWRMTVDDSGNPVFSSITCPN